MLKLVSSGSCSVAARFWESGLAGEGVCTCCCAFSSSLSACSCSHLTGIGNVEADAVTWGVLVLPGLILA